jgi:hypothetical protein
MKVQIINDDAVNGNTAFGRENKSSILSVQMGKNSIFIIPLIVTTFSHHSSIKHYVLL